MDELDRLFRRLVQNVRNGYPEYLSRPFEVSELYQTLIPYRHNRRELEMDTNQDYELALCRLLSGERGYAAGDEAMQRTLREEMASPNPNTAIFRDFAASRVQLVPEAVRRFEQAASAEAVAREPTLATPPTPPSRGAAQPPASRAAQAPRARSAATAATAESAPPPRAPSPAAEPAAAPARASAQRGAAPSPPSSPSVAQMIAGDASAQGLCRYCGGVLPGGRRAVFCPHCGQNLTVQRCPACGSELEVGWKFCITCGRGIGGQ